MELILEPKSLASSVQDSPYSNHDLFFLCFPNILVKWHALNNHPFSSWRQCIVEEAAIRSGTFPLLSSHDKPLPFLRASDMISLLYSTALKSTSRLKLNNQSKRVHH